MAEPELTNAPPLCRELLLYIAAHTEANLSEYPPRLREGIHQPTGKPKAPLGKERWRPWAWCLEKELVSIVDVRGKERPMLTAEGEWQVNEYLLVTAGETTASPRRKRGNRKVDLSRWAFGFDSKRWYVFHGKAVDGKVTWIEPTLVESLKGQRAKFALAIAEHGGVISRQEVVDLLRVGDRQRMEPKDVYRKVAVPTRAKLAGTIREAVARASGQEVRGNPLRWDGRSQSWRAAVEIGYAVPDDDGRLQFRTHEQLRAGEEYDAQRAR